MKLKDFRIAWRLLLREPGYSAISVLSLSVAFAACFLILGFVKYSFGYDRHVPDGERVYLMKFRPNIISQQKWLESIPMPFMDVAARSGMATGAAAYIELPSSMRADDRLLAVKLVGVTQGFKDIFGLAALEGDLNAALSKPDAIALTARTAERLCGSSHCVGKVVQIADAPYRVAAVVKDPPSNSTITYEALAPFNSSVWPEGDRQIIEKSWGKIGAKAYVKLAPGVAPAALQNALQEAADHSPLLSKLPPEALQKLGQKKAMEVELTRLTDVYFDAATADSPGSSQHGDRRSVFGLATVAILILVLAATNYVNLATVRTLRRQREIGVRKVLGAGAQRLVAQFLAESMVVTALAALIGVAIGIVFESTFCELINRQLDPIFSVGTTLGCLAFGLLVGAVAGLYPAYVAVGVRPAEVLTGRGNSDNRTAYWVRRLLTVVQFATAIGLAGISLTIAWQVRYATQIDPGFDARGLLVVDLPVDGNDPRSRSFKEALQRLDGVSGVAAASDAVGRSDVGMNLTVSRGGNNVAMLVRGVSREFFTVYAVRPVAGRLFEAARDPEQSADIAVVNRAAARVLGFASPEAAAGQIVNATNPKGGTTPVRIIGVAPDIRHQSARDSAQATMYQLTLATTVLTVRTRSDLAVTARAVEDAWRRSFPSELPQITTATGLLAANYADDLRLAKLLGLSTVVGLVLAAFGIYVLSAYTAQRRAREIVLRRLHGASNRAIAKILAMEFGSLILLGGLVGLPVAGIAAASYLAGFVERADIGPWALLAAFAAALLLAAASTLRHALAALRISPAVALRD